MTFVKDIVKYSKGLLAEGDCIVNIAEGMIFPVTHEVNNKGEDLGSSLFQVGRGNSDLKLSLPATR